MRNVVCVQPILSPQPRHAIATTGHTRRQQRPLQLDRAVPFFRLQMESLHLSYQSRIRSGPWTGRSAALCIIATPTDAQRQAQLHKPVLRLVHVDKSIPHGDALAVYIAAFFKMSRSSRSWAFSAAMISTAFTPSPSDSRVLASPFGKSHGSGMEEYSDPN